MQKLKIIIVALTIYSIATTGYIIYNRSESQQLSDIAAMMRMEQEKTQEKTKEAVKVRTMPKYDDIYLDGRPPKKPW